MLATVALLADEPTNAPPPVYVTTNYVKAHKSFRRVEGKLYNVEKSVLWREIVGTCSSVVTNGIIVRTVVAKSASYVLPPPDPGSNISNILSGSRPLTASVQTRTWREDGPALVLVNYEGPEPKIGQTIRVKAIKIGTATYEGEVMEKWDCGTPNIVPLLVTNPPALQPKTKRQASEPPVAESVRGPMP
jgi:hypothetical protein